MTVQPSTSPADQPTKADPFAQVNTGMRVSDVAGTDLGAVAEVQMPGTGRRDELDVPPEHAARLVDHGYLRVDGGVLSRDLYVEAGQVVEVTEAGADAAGVVTLNVTKEELTRAG